MNRVFPLFFLPSNSIETVCDSVGIINDATPEPVEQFSVILINALPEGTFIEDTSCISIIDDDRKNITVLLTTCRVSNPLSTGCYSQTP